MVKTKSGFVTVELKAMDNKGQLVILPISTTEGIIAGLGRGVGDTVIIKIVNGEQHIAYSGLEFEKIK